MADNPRAVVDKQELVNKYGEPMGLHFALSEALPALKQQAVEEYKAAQPRAVVALSEDRQWLVVLGDYGVWLALSKKGAGMITRYEFRSILSDDTGQDAHEVLHEFLDDEFLAERQG